MKYKKIESGYHKYAVQELASWVNGIIEQPFYIEGSIAFIPDIVCYENGILTRIYEVVHSHSINGKKLGLIQNWCYRNTTELSVFEVSSDFILRQIKKPGHIEIMEYYDINVLNKRL